jgi:hypothetical protein
VREGAPVKSNKDLRVQRAFIKVITFIYSKDTSKARTWNLSDSRPVILPLDQVFELCQGFLYSFINQYEYSIAHLILDINKYIDKIDDFDRLKINRYYLLIY